MTRSFDLYPRSRVDKGFASLFRNPTSEYRGAPLWSWNERLNIPRLERQIEVLHEMGMGGFHMHARTGLDTEYLGTEFMEAVKASVAKATDLKMLAWIYDEDRWPSGYAGGLLTLDERFRKRYLLFTPEPYGKTPPHFDLPVKWPVDRTGGGRLLARYEVVLVNDRLASYRRLREGEKASSPGGRIWHAYLEICLPCIGHNNVTLGDSLNPQATAKFIELTHERYFSAVGKAFGKTIPAIFADEPAFEFKQCLHSAGEARDLHLPWTDDLDDTYRIAFDCEILDTLPEIIWELPDAHASIHRWRFHEHLCERLVSGFLDPIGRWCESRGVAFTGHLVEELTMEWQTMAIGEVMRGYRAFQLPGIDILHDSFELVSAKQAQSAVRQFNRSGMISELYGVTGWDYSFADYKAQGDWQAALGVTIRAHHLAWVSMEGEAKRDYPGSISYQQPWWREYKLIEDHFARLATVLTRGESITRLAVIHPIESYWLCYGPQDQTRSEREEREGRLSDLTRWLLMGLIDFDFISESLLPGLCPAPAGAPLQVGAMRYDAVIVPGLRTIRSSTLDRLEQFAAAGGRVIFAGGVPELVDVAVSDRAHRLMARCEMISWSRREILEAVEPLRNVDVRSTDGSPVNFLLHQLRREGDRLHLFLCNTDRKAGRPDTTIRIAGRWSATQWDTLTGESQPCGVTHRNDHTLINHSFAAHDHLLLTLDPGDLEMPTLMMKRHDAGPRLPEIVPVELSEPNALVLNQARWRWNDEAWQEVEEVLRIEDQLRTRLGLPVRRSYWAQPWSDPGATPALGRVTLAFEIDCAHRVDQPVLAMERPGEYDLRLDGQPVAKLSDHSTQPGWWVDEAIRTLPLPALEPGMHVLEMTTVFHCKTPLEWAYLLGDFGVAVRGRRTRITAPVRDLAWGDWTLQGLPFYTGNVVYRCPLVLAQPRELRMDVAHFRNPLLGVAVDGRDAGRIAFAPWSLELRALTAGKHKLAITAFGSRGNAFGALHHPGPNNRFISPNGWRTSGNEWVYEYQLKPMGILAQPIITLG